MKINAIFLSLIVAVAACSNVEPAQDSEAIAARVSALDFAEPNADPPQDDNKDIPMGLSTTALTAVSVFTADVYPPNPGSAVQAADVQAGEQALLNRTQFLKDSLWMPYYYNSVSASLEVFSTTSYVSGSTIIADVPDCLGGDYILVDLQARASCSSVGAPGTGSLIITVVQDFGGSPHLTEFTGTERVVEDTGTAILNAANLSMSSMVVVAWPGTSRVLVRGKVTNASVTCGVGGPAFMRVQHFRKGT